jgi:hypothetical protein
MREVSFEAIHIEDIPEPEGEKSPDEPAWRPVRIHFGITSFGTNAYTARKAGQLLVEEHRESEESGTQHEELYFVATGHAKFVVAGTEVDAPAGTFLYVPDPDAVRSAVAEADQTTVLCFGGTPGEAFGVSPWERKYDPAVAES